VTTSAFNHVTDPLLREHAFAEWDRLREERGAFGACPAASAFGAPSDPEQTTWYLLRYEDVYEAYRNPRLFSSRGAQSDKQYVRLPLDLDPPEHAKYRRLLNGPLAPARVKDWEPTMREQCRILIETFRARGSCEFVSEFAYRYAPTISMIFLGLPGDEVDEFLDWSERARLGRKSDTIEEVHAAQEKIIAYLHGVLDDRDAEPRDDMITYLMQSEVDGRRLPRDEVVLFVWALFSAGLDTVGSATTYMFAHLASHTDDRLRILEDPSIIPAAVEELLRAYSVVVNERLVTQDTEFAGCPMKKGDRIALPTMSANRDPDAFPGGDRVDLSRNANRHIAFGAGSHRCAGSHLARLELQVALDEWHRVIPEYRIADGAPLVHFAGTVPRLEQLPLVW
jgi:cytochrome P450